MLNVNSNTSVFFFRENVDNLELKLQSNSKININDDHKIE